MLKLSSSLAAIFSSIADCGGLALSPPKNREASQSQPIQRAQGRRAGGRRTTLAHSSEGPSFVTTTTTPPLRSALLQRHHSQHDLVTHISSFSLNRLFKMGRRPARCYRYCKNKVSRQSDDDDEKGLKQSRLADATLPFVSSL